MTENPAAFDADWFFRRFTEKITWDEYSGIYKTDADFTPRVTAVINEIIEEGTGWRHQNEYFRIDAVGWETHYDRIKKEANDAGLNAHLWNLRIAVEHENNKRDWTDEVVKLMQLRCPIKVIIGYNYYDDRGENEQKKLNTAAKMIRELDSYPGIEHDREQILIILGNGCSRVTGKSDYTAFDYRGYLFDYQEGAFVRMPCEYAEASAGNVGSL